MRIPTVHRTQSRRQLPFDEFQFASTVDDDGDRKESEDEEYRVQIQSDLTDACIDESEGSQFEWCMSYSSEPCLVLLIHYEVREP